MEGAADQSESEDEVIAFFARLDARVQADPAAALVLLDSAPTTVKELDAWTLARAEVLRNLDGPNAAAAWLDTVVKQFPEFADAHHLLGAWLMETGSTEASTQHWLQTLQLDRTTDLVSDSPEPRLVALLEELARTVVASEVVTPSGVPPSARVRVAPRPSEVQVRGGMDPRACVAITDEPSHQDHVSRGSDGQATVWLFTQCLWSNTGLDEEELLEALPSLLNAELERYGLARSGRGPSCRTS